MANLFNLIDPPPRPRITAPEPEQHWHVFSEERYPYGRTVRVLRTEVGGGHIYRIEVEGTRGALSVPVFLFVPYSLTMQDAIRRLEAAFAYYQRLIGETKPS